MTAVFRDPATERAFRRRGFVVVDLWEPTAGDLVAQLFDTSDRGERDGYFVSTVLSDTSARAAYDELIRRTFASELAGLMNGYEAFLGALVVKRPTGATTVWAHQDGTCHDESFGPGVIAWIPVTEVDELSGHMRALWGSHRFLPGILATPPTKTCFEDVRDELLDREMPAVEVRRGQALVFNSLVIHGSPPNRSGANRLAAYLRFMPIGAPARHYWYDQDAEEVLGFEVGRDFFTTHVWGQRPTGEPFERLPVVEPRQLSIADLTRLRRRARLRPLSADRGSA